MSIAAVKGLKVDKSEKKHLKQLTKKEVKTKLWEHLKMNISKKKDGQPKQFKRD